MSHSYVHPSMQPASPSYNHISSHRFVHSPFLSSSSLFIHSSSHPSIYPFFCSFSHLFRQPIHHPPICPVIYPSSHPFVQSVSTQPSLHSSHHVSINHPFRQPTNHPVRKSVIRQLIRMCYVHFAVTNLIKSEPNTVSAEFVAFGTVCFHYRLKYFVATVRNLQSFIESE
jgi:hypothetical protein